MRHDGMSVMQGSPPPLDKRVTLDNWDLPPFNRWSFQNMRRVLPTAEIRRAEGPASALQAAPRDLSGLSFETARGGRSTIAAFLEETYRDGFLVLHQGRVVSEQYFNGMTRDSLHLAQSVSKSVVGTVAGIMIHRGDLDAAAPLADIIPELADTGYGDATTNHILSMISGIRFTEEYGLAESDISTWDIIAGWRPRPQPDDLPASIYEWIVQRPKARAHGGDFQYRSIETDCLGWVLERVSGLGLADLLSRELWAPMGAEHDANITVCLNSGFAAASGGLNASLRDYGRLGQLYLDGGRGIVAPEWIEDCLIGDNGKFVGDYRLQYPHGAYKNCWWIPDVSRRVMAARGVFGQLIYVDFEHRMVIVKLSSWPDYTNPDRSQYTARACQAIAESL
jgi:CubicO group peptidase (beta-lactamase class C family)